MWKGCLILLFDLGTKLYANAQMVSMWFYHFPPLAPGSAGLARVAAVVDKKGNKKASQNKMAAASRFTCSHFQYLAGTSKKGPWAAPPPDLPFRLHRRHQRFQKLYFIHCKTYISCKLKLAQNGKKCHETAVP